MHQLHLSRFDLGENVKIHFKMLKYILDVKIHFKM